LARFEDYAWPGNVRELHNAVARLLALGQLAAVDPLPSRPSNPPPAGDAIEAVLAENLAFPAARDRVLESFEQRYVTRVLEQHGGNVAEAAAASGIARRYFQQIKARVLK
jgi:DNA-binding NtrC family response regulator